MCKCADVQMKEKLEPAFLHLHICTFAHLHIRIICFPTPTHSLLKSQHLLL